MTPRLFMNIVSMQARKMMSYRADFWVNALAAFFIMLGVIYFLWDSIYAGTGQTVIAGYTFSEMLTYYVLVILLGKIVRGLDQWSGMSDEIYQGHYTRYLIYPVKYFPFKYAQHLGNLTPALMQLVLFGALLAVFLRVPDSIQITPATIAMTVGAVLMGNLLHFLIYCPIEGTAFWADNVWSLCVMMRFTLGFLGGQMLPLTLFPETIQSVNQFLPFQYVYFFPVQTLMGHVTPSEWLFGMGVTAVWILVFAGLTRLIWARGSYVYTGVGI
ncbi:ABC-2 family transporter protein [bacterium]|nr:ABC-2 family transporter protein [bacterium]